MILMPVMVPSSSHVQDLNLVGFCRNYQRPLLKTPAGGRRKAPSKKNSPRFVFLCLLWENGSLEGPSTHSPTRNFCLFRFFNLANDTPGYCHATWREREGGWVKRRRVNKGNGFRLFFHSSLPKFLLKERRTFQVNHHFTRGYFGQLPLY